MANWRSLFLTYFWVGKKLFITTPSLLPPPLILGMVSANKDQNNRLGILRSKTSEIKLIKANKIGMDLPFWIKVFS